MGSIADGLLITVEHAVSYQFPIKWTLEAGVNIKYEKGKQGKVTGLLGVSAKVEFQSQRELYRYWISYLICPTGNHDSKPSIQFKWQDASPDTKGKLIPYDLTIKWDY